MIRARQLVRAGPNKIKIALLLFVLVASIVLRARRARGRYAARRELQAKLEAAEERRLSFLAEKVEKATSTSPPTSLAPRVMGFVMTNDMLAKAARGAVPTFSGQGPAFGSYTRPESV